VWRVYPDGCCYDMHWLTGLWSTQAKVEGIVPKTAWHWDRGSSVVNNCLGEPGHTPFCVGLPSAWGSLDDDLMFFLYVCRRAPFHDSSRHT
jgi:hypothetical protein